MNRRTLILTIIIMTIALSGLMVIQIYWIRNASTVREAGFRRSINEAIYRVVVRIERLEKKMSLKELPYESMLSFNRHMPYEKFMTVTLLDSMITQELNIRGIDTQFEFGIYKPERYLFQMEKSPNYRQELIQKGYAFPLFQADIFTSPEYLIIFFPNERYFLLTRLWGMLLVSMVLIIVIVYAYLYTLTTLFHQKRLSELKNDFINNMTHEFRTPISTISLACEALGDKDMLSSEDAVGRYVAMIREENMRLSFMAEKILQTAVLDKGQLRMKKERIDLHGIIADVVKNIRIQVEIKDGEIQTALKAPQHEIEGDRIHLTNLVYNLLDNANKYSPKKPLIQIETGNTDSGILMVIQDNGIGIRKQDQKKIFHRLYRVPTGNIHEVRGFGLGLSYVKAIVEEHHGKISLESDTGKGTCFRIVLPFAQEE